MRNKISLLSITTVCLIGTSLAQAESTPDQYISDALKDDKAFSESFTAAIQPVLGDFPWVAKGGVATPAITVQKEGNNYLLYQGCKPHDCITQSYAVLYSPDQQEVVAAAFVDNDYMDQNLVNSQILWTGSEVTGFAPVLASYLF